MDEKILSVISASLEKECAELNMAVENTLYYTGELARFLACGCDDIDDFISKYRQFQEILDDKNKSNALKNDFPAAKFLLAAEITKRSCAAAYLCREACSILAKSGLRVAPTDFFDADADTQKKIAYSKGAITDAAFRSFDKLLCGASVLYTDSFAAACEEVYYGHVPLCILPCETSSEGVLSSFSRLIKKYELYEQCICACHTESGSTKMALLGRYPCVLPITGATKLLLKASFYAPTSDTFAKITSAAMALDLSVERVDTVPISWDDALQGFELTFSGEQDCITHFLLYLTLEAPECSDKYVYFEI